nr:MAG TPA: hypothetical protein [Caudoviricetes sp.]
MYNQIPFFSPPFQLSAFRNSIIHLFLSFVYRFSV